MSIPLAEDIEKLRCLQKLHFKRTHISCLLLAYALTAFCGNIFPYIPVGFLSVYSTTQKRHLFWWRSPLPSPQSFFSGNTSKLWREKQSQNDAQIFWLVHSGLLGPFSKTGAQNDLENPPSSTKSMPAYLLPHRHFVSPLRPAFPSAWTLHNRTPVVPFLVVAELYKHYGVFSSLSLYHFHVSQCHTRGIFSYISNDSVFLFLQNTVHIVIANI